MKCAKGCHLVNSNSTNRVYSISNNWLFNIKTVMETTWRPIRIGWKDQAVPTVAVTTVQAQRKAIYCLKPMMFESIRYSKKASLPRWTRRANQIGQKIVLRLGSWVMLATFQHRRPALPIVDLVPVTVGWLWVVSVSRKPNQTRLVVADRSGKQRW